MICATDHSTRHGRFKPPSFESLWDSSVFKWIKQHLKVKRFVGRSKNAVMTQLWVAMCMYLLLAYLKFVMRLRWSLHQMLQVLQLNMFERRPLQDLFTTPSLPAPSGSQLSLAWVLKMWDTSVIQYTARNAGV